MHRGTLASLGLDEQRVEYERDSEGKQESEEEGPTEPENPDYQRLLDAYAGKVVHGSQTLDESYYHSLTDPDAISDMARRNRDQVVTKRVQSFPYKNQKKPWTIIRVDQLWIWVIDSGMFRDSYCST